MRPRFATTVSILKVGDCVAIHYQVTQKLKRATSLEFTTIPPIFYIHCVPLLHNFLHCFFNFTPIINDSNFNAHVS